MILAALTAGAAAFSFVAPPTWRHRCAPSPRMGPLAEDEWLYDGEENDADDMQGLSYISAAEAHDELDVAEIATLLSAWQEKQALADSDGSTPTMAEQAEMAGSWSALVDRRESALRKQRQRTLDASSWVPAHLTSFSDETDEVDTDGDTDGDTTDPDDESFVFEWQKHAEAMRQQQENALEASAPEASAKSGSLIYKLRGQRKADGGQAPMIGIDLGTTCAPHDSNPPPCVVRWLRLWRLWR